MRKTIKMTRTNFLNLKFPLLPYCEVKRTLSTQFNEGMHIENKNTGICLNFLYRNNDTVSVGIVYKREPNPFKQYDTVFNSASDFSQETVIELCEKHLR